MTFPQMMRLVRQGNQEAAARLVKQFEPKIHIAIRRLLQCHRLRREFDAHDISQVVLSNFFVRNLAVRCKLKRPDELERLLVRMAKNKVRDEVRKMRAGRRDHRRLEPGHAEYVLNTLMQRNANPVKIVAGRELMNEFLLRLNADERALAEKRSQGIDWVAIASEHGESAEALRKKLARAVERVRYQLDL
jgi:DNA-directed RNA polymerase specialized sigma24 family protein